MSRPVEDMQCSEVVERLEEWMDGDLGHEDGVRIEHHLENCPECRREHRLAEAIQRGLRGLPVYTLPPKLADAAVESRKGNGASDVIRDPRRRSFRSVRYLAAAAALILAVVLIEPWQRPEPETYSEQEVQQAADETLLAFSYIGSAAKRAGQQARSRVLQDQAVTTTVLGISRSLKWLGGTDSMQAGPLQETGDEGSSL